MDNKCIVLELVPLGGKINFKPCPYSSILITLKCSFQNFCQVPPSHMGVPPGCFPVIIGDKYLSLSVVSYLSL